MRHATAAAHPSRPRFDLDEGVHNRCIHTYSQTSSTSAADSGAIGGNGPLVIEPTMLSIVKPAYFVLW